MKKELTKKQFDVLVALEETNEALSQRQLENVTKISLGTINKVVKELSEEGLIENNKITDKGIDILEPYRAKRAVFIAAGFGSRMVPVTLNTPKPLVRVHGQRIIDGLLDAVLKVGIEEIYIVRGYLSEQFDQLLYKYPMIKFIENHLYNEANNISSAFVARYLLENAYVFEADLLISNPDIITKYHYASNYLGIPVDRSDDWCFEIDKDSRILDMKIGGENCYQVVGISYWNQEDGKKLSNHIKEAYEQPGGKESFWDLVALKKFQDQYNVYVKECKQEDVIEIDTFNELKKIDKTYDM